MAERKAKWQNDYIARTYDRINLTVPKGGKEAIKSHAEKLGESVNGFINRAIMEVTEMDNMHTAYQRGLLRHLERAMDAMESNNHAEAKKLLAELIEDTKADTLDKVAIYRRVANPEQFEYPEGFKYSEGDMEKKMKENMKPGDTVLTLDEREE